MALRVMSVTDMRLEVLLEAARSGETVTAICERFGISRETYDVYLRRYRSEGLEGLEPRSRQPLHQPQRMPAQIEEQICRMRKDHPKWGARRIRAELEEPDDQAGGPTADTKLQAGAYLQPMVANTRAIPHTESRRAANLGHPMTRATGHHPGRPLTLAGVEPRRPWPRARNSVITRRPGPRRDRPGPVR